ncbi:hypothetical protein Nepgr_010458 [Nepenthes gracilis]|uniref:Uncharacterized protein n=1 Tax=Nepenthes gracilis TaxID=150966 RepID=A0AAD3SCK5_NEPGR|nr:hypothetical protein Nepgr_010458 [Nepenthes gracilis]
MGAYGGACNPGAEVGSHAFDVCHDDVQGSCPSLGKLMRNIEELRLQFDSRVLAYFFPKKARRHKKKRSPSAIPHEHGDSRCWVLRYSGLRSSTVDLSRIPDVMLLIICSILATYWNSQEWWMASCAVSCLLKAEHHGVVAAVLCSLIWEACSSELPLNYSSPAAGGPLLNW